MGERKVFFLKPIREEMVASSQRRTSTTETLHDRAKRINSPLIIHVKKKNTYTSESKLLKDKLEHFYCQAFLLGVDNLRLLVTIRASVKGIS